MNVIHAVLNENLHHILKILVDMSHEFYKR
nr:MAG TPA_asm: hypothetical protein [Caudoviricetes sp.]